MKINIGKFPKNKPRRINIQIDPSDTWNMDSTLAHIILPMLIQLKAQKQGVPAEFAEIAGGADYDEQMSFDFYKETHNTAFDRACDQWDEILDKMIWSFTQLIDTDWESKYRHGEAEITWEKTDEIIYNPVTKQNENTYQMVDKNPSGHWTDITGIMLHQERIQEGLELFGKYFKNLWD